MDDTYKKVSEDYKGFNRMSFIARCYERNLSWLEKRRVLSASMIKYCRENGTEAITKTIKFENNDIMDFLKRFRKFEEESRKVNFRVC